MKRSWLFVSIGLAALAGAAHAGSLDALSRSAITRATPAGQAILVDWQDPRALPRRFRNHCTFERWSGRPYCENHCGGGYEFFFCSPISFGCCAVGFGYCDGDGNLRCHP